MCKSKLRTDLHRPYCTHMERKRTQERLLSEHEASVSATESKLKAAAAELRAAEASKDGLQRELAACEGRLEESARLLDSNQQVIKWLNKELNDAQMVPGGVTAAAAAAVSEAGLAYGGRAPSSSPLGGDYGFERAGGRDGGGGGGGGDGGGGGGGGSGTDVMFTTGIRESLAGGVRWNLRGTTLDRGGGDRNGEYVPRRDDAAAAVGGEGPLVGVVESTPDHAGRGGHAGGVGRGGYSRVVTPESGGVSDPAQASSRFLPQKADETVGKGDWYEDEGGGTGDGQDDELAIGRGVLSGGAVRGIRAF